MSIPYSQSEIRLGDLSVGGLWLAPMAGYTDIAFRTLARRFGAGLTVTEMVSVRGLVHGNEATASLIATSDAEAPSCVQLFGSDPDDFSRAAEKLTCDIIDINMGCPMPKIVKNGDGAALMLDPSRAAEIVRAVVSASGKPVTVKTRLGYRMGELTCDRLIDAVTEAGASAVTVHGRYAEQRYAGSSDIVACRKLAERAAVPIIYSGDVDRDSLCAGKFEGFSGVTIGRNALSDIGVFSGVQPDPFDVALELVELLTQYFDERYTVFQARKFFVHIFKGRDGARTLRAAVNVAKSPKEIIELLLSERCKMKD